MNTHKLKTWPEYFDAVALGRKTFEVRKKDRDYRVGDMLVLQKYDPISEKYLKQEIRFYISYILDSFEIALHNDYCIIGLSDKRPL